MNASDLVQTLVSLAVLLACAQPLGTFMAKVYEGERQILSGPLRPLERLIYRLSGVDEKSETSWDVYAFNLLSFSATGVLLVYGIQRLQAFLPLNPAGQAAVSPDLAFNTAISFVTNTNWQAYGGEATLSYLTQMLALGVQNFLSAAAGMAVAVALFRGLARKTADTAGNFWVDLVRGALYILLPLSLILALALVSQGVVQTFSGPVSVKLLDPAKSAPGALITTQTLPLGPAASQIAIKQLGTNGGGYFNANSAHPLENPTPLSNFLEVVSILLLPAAFCLTFGRMVRDLRQGWVLLAAMLLIFVPFLFFTMAAESEGNPALSKAGIDQAASALHAGGNMEGKEVRFGSGGSALWAAATTAASNGSVNSMHDSFTPLGGLFPMLFIQLGEVVFGGVGSGVYGMLLFVIIAVFAAGLMVGRTPEYLGKKIEAFEIKMACLAILAPSILVLGGTALAVTSEAGIKPISNPGPHGFSQVLYALSSASNNNGSAFAGLGANTPFYNTLLGFCMFVGRFGVAIPVLAIASSLGRKKTVPAGPGTLPTHTPLFVVFLAGVVLLVGALTFLPAAALGPIAEHLVLLK